MQGRLEKIIATWTEERVYTCGHLIRNQSGPFLVDGKMYFETDDPSSNQTLFVEAEVAPLESLSEYDVIAYTKRTPWVPRWVSNNNFPDFEKTEYINYKVFVPKGFEK